MELELIAIKKIIDEYEKKRKKTQIIEIISGILLLILAFLIMWKGDVQIHLYSVAPILGGYVGVFFRMGSKRENEHIEEIKSIFY